MKTQTKQAKVFHKFLVKWMGRGRSHLVLGDDQTFLDDQ